MTTLSTVLLSIKGDARKAQLQLPTNDLTLEILQKYFKKKDAPELILTHPVENMFLHVFGYKKGKKGTENKSVIPALSGQTTVFGDAMVIATLQPTWNHPLPFTVEQWSRVHGRQDVPTQKEEKQKPTRILEDEDLDKLEEDEEEEEEEEEQEQEQEQEEEEEVIEEEEEYGEESESEESVFDKEEEQEQEQEQEQEEAPQPVKRRRAATAKVDPTALKDDIDMESPPESHPIRTTCLSRFDFLKGHFSKEKIRGLERSLFETSCQYARKVYVVQNWKSPQFVEIYKQHFRSIVSNLHPQSPVKNPRLLHRILEGEFELSAIPFMSSYEMYPEKWFELKDKLMQREQKILEGNKCRATDQFKCRRCGKRECTYYELQTRSGDEPMTIFIMCLNCGKEWRQGG